MLIKFRIEGPFEVPRKRYQYGNELDEEGFWQQESVRKKKLAGAKGCYIFALRGARGNLMPYYVGKTARRFQDEIFADHKSKKYHNVIVKKWGTPVMFFVVYPSTRGRVNSPVLKELEQYLIQLGVDRNPNLRNKTGTKGLKWAIKGVLGHRRGAQGKSVKQFVKLMDI